MSAHRHRWLRIGGPPNEPWDANVYLRCHCGKTKAGGGVKPVTGTLFDELRGAVVDLPVGRIAPGWVEKGAVIRMIDRIQEERER